MNFTTPNSPTKSSSYQHRASYYAPNSGKYSRSPHHTSRTSFNSHSHPQAYHPRLINTQSLKLKLTAATPTTTTTSTPSATPNTSPQQNTNQSQPQSQSQSQPSTPNHIKKNYHFSAKSSELFIKKKQLLSNRNTRFDAMPATPQTHIQLLPLTRPTISFSSQHTPQSFIANQSSTPNNSPHNTLSTVSTTSPSMVSHSNTTMAHNDYKNNRKSRWNYKADHRSNANRHRHRSHSHRHNHSLSRSRSRSRSSKLCKKSQKGSDSELKTNNESFTNHNKYSIRSDIHTFSHHKSKQTKANYAKQELQRQHRHATYTYTLRKYMCRNHARRRQKNIKSRHKPHHQWPYEADANLADDENENANGNEADCMLQNYDIDIHNSDYAIYEPPFKKPRFMKKLKPFLSTQPMPHSLVKKIGKLNRNLLSQRSKKRKQREQYIQIERAQSAHWNIAASKCWFIRCVHMLEGHVLTMCSSPDFASGVSYPRKPLDEIEKKLQRIHPLPPLIYGRLMKTLHNLSNLMREYPHVVQWDGAKLRSIFEKAIRKQLQMKGIYQFESAQCVLVEYDFTPFALPQYERRRVSFYLEQDGNARVHTERADLAQCQKRDESIEIGVGCIDEEEEEENDEETDIFIHKAHTPLRLRLQSQSRSVTPGMMSEMTPMLSSNQSRNNSLTPVICENVNKLPSYLHAKQKKLHLNAQSDDLMMETHLNMDLVRKSKVTFNLNENKFVVSPKIEKLVSANCTKLAQEDIETHSRLNVCKDTVKEAEIEKEAEPGNKPRKYTWIIETLDSNDESIDVWLRQKKQKLLDVFAHNGVYGHIKAIGLEPTYCELPTFGQHGYEDLDGKRLPSLYYLISKYVDCSNPWYIKMLLKYFDVETHKYCNCAANIDNVYTDLSCLFLRKYVHKEPKSLRYAFIGTVQDKDEVHSTVVMDIYMDIKDKECYIRLKLNEDKRHKLLCLLLRIKNKCKHNKHTDTRCIPQPPPPPPEESGSVENNKRILLMNAICVNYNWNGYCEATYCNKKHECCCCGEKHPARICGKQCIDYNWAKCLRLCPKNKQHSCSQCGDSKHPAWRCQYLHRSVTERYYAIYKTKKLRNGYFKLLEKKEKKKNIEWINRRYKPLVGVGNGSVIHVNNNRHQQQRHHYQNSQKGKKRSSRK